MAISFDQRQMAVSIPPNFVCFAAVDFKCLLRPYATQSAGCSACPVKQNHALVIIIQTILAVRVIHAENGAIIRTAPIANQTQYLSGSK